MYGSCKNYTIQTYKKNFRFSFKIPLFNYYKYIFFFKDHFLVIDKIFPIILLLLVQPAINDQQLGTFFEWTDEHLFMVFDVKFLS